MLQYEYTFLCVMYFLISNQINIDESIIFFFKLNSSVSVKTS